MLLFNKFGTIELDMIELPSKDLLTITFLEILAFS